MKNNKLGKRDTRCVLLTYIAVKEAATAGQWATSKTPHEYATDAATCLFMGLGKKSIEEKDARTEVLRELMLAGLWFPPVRVVQPTTNEEE